MISGGRKKKEVSILHNNFPNRQCYRFDTRWACEDILVLEKKTPQNSYGLLYMIAWMIWTTAPPAVKMKTNLQPEKNKSKDT